MFFGRFGRSLSAVLRRHPAWRGPLSRVLHAMEKVPTGAVIDPALVASQAGLDRGTTLAYLNVLREAGLGDLVVRVVRDSGEEIKRFPTVADVPSRVEDEFGDELVVMPENIDVAFEPHLPRDRSHLWATVGDVAVA